jgi:hypothetical protein
MLMNTLIGTCFLTTLANASLHASPKRRHTELLDSYDFVVAGGGTSGLTVADRLSKALPNSTPALFRAFPVTANHSSQRRSLSLSMVRSNMHEVFSIHQTLFLEALALHQGLDYSTSSRCPIQK